MSTQAINISTSTILRVVAILLALIFLYLIRDILVIVFLAVIIAAAVNGPASRLQKYHIPRLLGVIFIYLLVLFIVGLIVSLIFPPLAGQIKQLAAQLPEYTEKIGLNFQHWWGEAKWGYTLQNVLEKAGNKLSQIASGIFSTTIDFFGGLFSIIFVVVISFYLSVQEKGAKKFLVSLAPEEHRAYLSELIDRIERKIGSWLRGQLILMLIIGILVFIGLYFLGVKYALVLALLAGLLEIVPYVGPVMSAVPAVILAFIQSPFLALLVVILYIAVQQIESYAITPQVMKKAVGLNPVVVIIVMLIGAKLAGILGIIISVPLTAAISEFLRDLRKGEV